MRSHLEIHHIKFRSRGGNHATGNLITLCCAHHGLIHQHICGVEGKAPEDLHWTGPFLNKWPGAVERFRNGVRGGEEKGESAVQEAPMEAPPSTTDEKAPEVWRKRASRRAKLGERNQGSREHVFAALDEQLKGHPSQNKAGASSFPPNYG